MRGIVDLFAQYERALIRTRTRNALAVKKAKRERTGSVPYGYRLANDGRSLVEDEAEQRAVRAVRELRAAGLTYRAVCVELERAGYVPRSGKGWLPMTVQRIAEAV